MKPSKKLQATAKILGTQPDRLAHEVEHVEAALRHTNARDLSAAQLAAAILLIRSSVAIGRKTYWSHLRDEIRWFFVYRIRIKALQVMLRIHTAWMTHRPRSLFSIRPGLRAIDQLPAFAAFFARSFVNCFRRSKLRGK